MLFHLSSVQTISDKSTVNSIGAKWHTPSILYNHFSRLNKQIRELSNLCSSTNRRIRRLEHSILNGHVMLSSAA